MSFFFLKESTLELVETIAISSLATIKVFPIAIVLSDKLFHCFKSVKETSYFLAIFPKLSPF